MKHRFCPRCGNMAIYLGKGRYRYCRTCMDTCDAVSAEEIKKIKKEKADAEKSED